MWIEEEKGMEKGREGYNGHRKKFFHIRDA